MKLAVISGGSRGLGAAVVEAYLKEGYQVVEFSRSAPHPFSVRADLAHPEEAASVAAAKLSSLSGETYEEIVIVNNAGTVTPVGPTARKGNRDIVQNLNTNFVTPILIISEGIRQFQSQPCKKTIAHITSGAATHGYAGLSLYCGAKAGMENFLQSVALEQQAEAHPFHAICIDPGVIDTEMQKALRESNDADFPNLGRFRDLKRNGQLRSPAQVADAVLRVIRQNDRYGGRYSASDFIR